MFIAAGQHSEEYSSIAVFEANIMSAFLLVSKTNAFL